MRAFSVGRVMPKGDQPLVGVRGKVFLQPPSHRPIAAAILRHGIQTHEMNISVIEGVVILRARRQSAGLPRRRQGKNGEIRQRRLAVIGFVIANRRPDHRFAQHRRIHVEHRGLIFLVRSVAVSVVAKHQPQVGVSRASQILVSIAHRCGLKVRRARVAQHPNARRLWPVRSGHEEVIGPCT